MSRKYARRGDRGFIGYVCKTYKTQGKSQCTSHSIDVEDLEYAVLQSIKYEASKILQKEDIDELVETGKISDKDTDDDLKSLKDQAKELGIKGYTKMNRDIRNGSSIGNIKNNTLSGKYDKR